MGVQAKTKGRCEAKGRVWQEVLDGVVGLVQAFGDPIQCARLGSIDSGWDSMDDS